MFLFEMQLLRTVPSSVRGSNGVIIHFWLGPVRQCAIKKL